MRLEPALFRRVARGEVAAASSGRDEVEVIETFGVEVLEAPVELGAPPANQNGAGQARHEAAIVPFASTLRHIA